MNNITIKSLSVNNLACTGITVQWEDGQFVFITCEKGIVACGAIDVPLMDEHKQGILTAAFGTEEKHLIWPEDLLEAPIEVLTDKAKQVGIKKGMTGRQALEIMSKL